MRSIFFCLLIISTYSLTAQYSFTNYTTDDGLASNVVNCVKVDRKDNVYFGTNAGLSIFDQAGTWTTITTADGIIDDAVKAVHITNDGDIVIGTDLGISIGDGSTFKNYTSVDGIGNDRIEAITEDDLGQLYFATKGGFLILDKDGNWQIFGIAEGLPFGGVKDIEVQNNLVWLATGLSGVILYNTITNSIINIEEGPNLLSNATTGIVIGESSAWISSGAGINKFDNIPGILEFESHPSVFDLPPPHTLNQVVDIQLDSKGTVWAGIYIDYLVNVGGITFYDGAKWTTLNVDDGLIGPVVTQLAIDSQDAVWVSTGSGVSKYAMLTATDDLELHAKYSISPNPTANIISLTLDQPASYTQPITLYTSALHQVESKTLDLGQQSLSFNLSNLSSGIYYIRVGERLEKVLKL